LSLEWIVGVETIFIVISGWSIKLMDETRLPSKNYPPVASHCGNFDGGKKRFKNYMAYM
jgi:hypothetical protein